MYFVVNHSNKYVYRLSNWRETFDEVMDANPNWRIADEFDCFQDDIEPIENLLKLGYATNLGIYELPVYIRDPECLVWYMDTHGWGLYDITRAIKIWDGTEKFTQANSTIDDMIEWKREQEYMSGEKDATGYADQDEMMLCEMMTHIM